MPFVTAAGVQVNFPFEPYPCQVVYMDKVITCLKEGYNGVLESPTGTGKTLCLLCASLAWLEVKKAQVASQRWVAGQMSDGVSDNPAFSVDMAAREVLSDDLNRVAGAWGNDLVAPKIIFASRTHSQLSQAIQELKRTAYSHFSACIIGSREQLCIHPQVVKETSNNAKVHLCHAKVSARICHPYNQVENGKGNFTNRILDIEDLVTLGQKLQVCPYYTARELKKEADIIFMPYNYLLDPKSRKAHGVDLQNNIVIFDEAHNLEKMCEESVSFDMSSGDLATAINELTDVLKKLQELETSGNYVSTESELRPAVEEFSIAEVLDIKVRLLELEKEIDSLSVPSDGVTHPGRYIFELFEKAHLTFENKTVIGNISEKIITYLTNDASNSVFSSRGNGLSKILDVIKIVFSREQPDFSSLANHKNVISKHYRVHIKDDIHPGKKSGWDKMPSAKASRVVSYWCFSPGHAMDDLKSHGVKSIILTSGTLSPIPSLVSEMGIEFKVQLENPHVISSDQVWVGTLATGPDGVTLSSSYETRFKPAYQVSLGNAVVNFSRAIPHGLLLFFPSYPVMEKCLAEWQKSGVWPRIEQHKPMFVEPKSKSEFNTAMNNFYERVNDGTSNGAVFAAVCRGKVSEGLDFADCNGRAVVITGLPFPPVKDPKVVLKMKFLDDIRAENGKGLSGQDWYRLQASRAVNQAIGRVIRHRQDYGAIILCDIRFSGGNYVSQLPAWLRPSVKNYTDFGKALRDMTTFFKNAEKTLPAPVQTRKRKKPGEMGCQGAFFMPSETRSTSVARLPKAAIVDTHVSSLRPTTSDGDTSFTKILLQYDGSDGSRTPAPAPKTVGLLGALERIESRAACSSSKALCPSGVEETCAPSADEVQRQRKKIVIKPRESGSSKVTADNVLTAEQYVAQVKHILSVDSYSRFKSALHAYKSDGDIMQVMHCLIDIFGSDSRNFHLLRNFIRFVRREDRDKFHEILRKISGKLRAGRSDENVQSTTGVQSLPSSELTRNCSTALPKAAGKSSGMNEIDSQIHLNVTDHLGVGNHLTGLSVANRNASQHTSAMSGNEPEQPLSSAAVSTHSVDVNLHMHFDASKSGRYDST